MRRSGEGEKGRCLPWSKEEEGAYIFWMKQVPVFTKYLIRSQQADIHNIHWSLWSTIDVIDWQLFMLFTVINEILIKSESFNLLFIFLLLMFRIAYIFLIFHFFNYNFFLVWLDNFIFFDFLVRQCCFYWLCWYQF